MYLYVYINNLHKIHKNTGKKRCNFQLVSTAGVFNGHSLYL